MNLVEEVLVDINSKFSIHCNQNDHISENNLNLIQDVLSEFHDETLSQNTIDCIKRICIYRDQNNNNDNRKLTLSGAVPETPFIPPSRKPELIATEYLFYDYLEIQKPMNEFLIQFGYL